MKQMIPFAIPIVFSIAFYALAILDYKYIKRSYSTSRLARLLVKRGDV